MAAGIHVRLELHGVADCPAAALSEAVPVDDVTVDAHGTGATRVVGEVTVDGAAAGGAEGLPVTGAAGASDADGRAASDADGRAASDADGRAALDADGRAALDADGRVDEVFHDGSRSIYRYAHGDACPCTRVPSHGCPVRDLHAADGGLELSFVATDLETVRTVTADLQSCCADVTVRRLTSSSPADDDGSLVVADRSAFTTRQFEVLETAHEMGYFESPKGANSGTVAAELGISVSTFLEHLSVAQTKLFDQVVSN